MSSWRQAMWFPHRRLLHWALVQDDELSPRQLRALEKALGQDVRVCDRTMLILDIFSQRAGSKEGQLQVRRPIWYARAECMPRATGFAVPGLQSHQMLITGHHNGLLGSA